MDKSIIIIGAGIAGLSAGCYGQMNGYHTSIFEMHNKPGGVCTSWKRKLYTIDVCIQGLLGSAPGNSFYRIWEELGAVQGRRMIDHEEYMRIEGKEGEAFILYTNIDRMEQHMNELAPEDKDVIADFIKALRSCTRLAIPTEKVPELCNPIDKLKMVLTMFPFVRFMRKWGNISIQDFARRFKNPLLREAFSTFMADPDASMVAMTMPLAWLHQKVLGYPMGGSLEFARAVEGRYLGLGGEIHYESPVAKILVEDNQAVGVRLANGTMHYSDIVISAADGHTTIFDMLDGEYTNSKIVDYYEQLPTLPPAICISLGVARPFDELPHSTLGINYALDKPTTIAGKEWRRLGVHVQNFDPSLAPAGKAVLTVMLSSDYEYWSKLMQDSERYQAEKEQIADEVIALLDQRFPGLASQVEMRDVATPVTWQRYTGNWRGSHHGWLITTKTLGMRMSKTLPRLRDFYMIGQWVEPGGTLPVVAMSGRNVIQIICKGDGKQFVTSTP